MLTLKPSMRVGMSAMAIAMTMPGRRSRSTSATGRLTRGIDAQEMVPSAAMTRCPGCDLS